MPELSLSPAGHFYLRDVEPAGELPALANEQISTAFAKGAAYGLLHLAAVEFGSSLPPSLAFGRELAQRFMTAWCAVPDLTRVWEQTQLPAPRQQLEQLINTAPPMQGAEYLDLPCLEQAWQQLHIAAKEEINALAGDVAQWLQGKHQRWSLLGRVCFHLAENKNSEQTPFAFLATYAAGLSGQARVQHQPLGKALQLYAGAGDKETLLKLLQPVNKAAQNSPWLNTLVESGAIFRPSAWTPAEAYRFLQDIPLFEASGIVVRVPDWWQARRALRPQVRVTIGKQAAGLGLDAMLDFDLSLMLGSETLTEAEWQQLLARGEGLIRMKGQWIEMDWADMCKHVAAALYGVGNRLDSQPELLFLLRGVDPQELIIQAGQEPELETTADAALQDEDLSALFGIDLAEPLADVVPEETGIIEAKRGRGKTRKYDETVVLPKAVVSKAVVPKRKREQTLKMEPIPLSPAGGDNLPSASLTGEKTSKSNKPALSTLGKSKVSAQELLAMGIPRHQHDSWINAGVLLRTAELGVYQTTSKTGAAIDAYCQRQASVNSP